MHSQGVAEPIIFRHTVPGGQHNEINSKYKYMAQSQYWISGPHPPMF